MMARAKQENFSISCFLFFDFLSIALLKSRQFVSRFWIESMLFFPWGVKNTYSKNDILSNLQ
jgi:hypothetical protein